MSAVITGKRVRLRPFTGRDLSRLLAILHEPEIARWWGPYDEPRARGEFVEDPLARPFVVELAGETIGFIVYYEQTDPWFEYASIDLALDTAHLGQGFGSEALRTLARYLVDERGHHRITIDPAADNERAIAAYRKVGFKPVGIMRQYERRADGLWHDGLLMDLLKDELTEG